MSPAPADVSDPGRIANYADAWAGLMDLVRHGHSWSGNERNRFFLNDTRGKFYEASRLSGFDFPDDGRGLAVVDWDQDGDLDLWFRNRTAPRLRLMLNGTVSAQGGKSGSVAIRLEGSSSNRDGVGAVVELVTDPPSGRLVRSVRAGDLFLSQSSKWLHFGLGGFAGTIREAAVLWPGGQRELFSGVSVEGRFLLKQGAGRAVAWSGKLTRGGAAFATGEIPQPAALVDGGIARIILPARVPMPAVIYRDQAARITALQPGAAPRLIVIWSSSCPHCRKELRGLAAAQQVIRASGMEVLALSTDGLSGPAADTSESYDLIDQLGFPFPWGFIDGASAGRIQQLQAALFDRTPADSVPLAILLDQGGNAVAIYRGPFETRDVLDDLRAIMPADDQQLYHLAPPLAGTWFTNPLGRAQVAGFIAQRFASPR